MLFVSMTTTPWTAPALIRRSVRLFRERPSLALPVLLADVLAFAVMHLQKLLQKPLLELFFTSKQSVLSSHTAFAITSTQTHRATLLITALVWVAYFFSGLFYTAALVAISTLIVRDRAFPALRAKKNPILRFSLFFWALILGGWIISSPILSLVTQPWVVEHTHGIGLVYGAGLVIETVIAIFALGPALRLLNPTARVSSLAIFAAILTLLAQGAIDLAFRQLPLNTIFQNPTVFDLLLLQLVVSLLAAIPYVFLFIALSLLANPLETSSSPKAGLDDRWSEPLPDLASDQASTPIAPELP